MIGVNTSAVRIEVRYPRNNQSPTINHNQHSLALSLSPSNSASRKTKTKKTLPQRTSSKLHSSPYPSYGPKPTKPSLPTHLTPHPSPSSVPFPLQQHPHPLLPNTLLQKTGHSLCACTAASTASHSARSSSAFWLGVMFALVMVGRRERGGPEGGWWWGGMSRDGFEVEVRGRGGVVEWGEGFGGEGFGLGCGSFEG